MKKVLSFILVLSMVLSSFGMAFAAPAKNEIAGHLNEDATLRLVDLGIVQGDDRGFALDANITRAEFAVLLVRALGLEGSANVAKGETQFTDVTVAAGYEWASGAINVATRLGYIQGYGNGKFGPADSIRYEDAITLVVRALGYEPAAQAKGGYPVGYLVVAEQDVKNTKHVEGATGVAITRGSVFQLLDNSLTKAKMVQVGFGNDTKFVVSGTGKGADYVAKQTILTTNLGFDEVEGTVVANHRVAKLKANEIEIKQEKVNGDKDNAAVKPVKYTISDKAEYDVDAILGLKVAAWYNDDNEKLFRYEVITEDDQILYDTLNKVAEKTKSRETYFETTPVVLDDAVKFTEDAVVYVNNVKEDAEYLQEMTDKLAKDTTLNYYGRIVLNDYKEIEFAYLFDFSADMVGMAQELKKDEIKFINLDSAKEDVIELDDAEEVFVFNPDFTKASLEDIEAGSAVFGWVDEDDNYFLVVKNDRVEGKLEAVRVANNRVTVGGKNVTRATYPLAIFSGNQGEDYSFWKDTNFKDVEEFIDEEVTVVLDLAGKAMVLTTDVNVTSSTIYGVATYLTEGRNPVLSVFTSEGKEVEYKFEDRTDATILDKKVNVSSTNFKDGLFAGVEFKVNKDGEIVEDTLKVNNKVVELSKKDNQRFVTDENDNKYNLRTNTVVIKALNSSEKLKPSVIKYEDINKKAFDAETAMVIGEVGKDAKLIVFTNPKFQATEDSKYGVVTGEPERVAGGDYKVEVDVAGEGKVTYVLASRDEVRKGDLVRFTLNNKGELVAEKTLNSKDKNIATELQVVTEEVDKDYLEVDGVAYLVDAKETPIYRVNDKGALQSNTVNLSRVKKGDVVILITDLEDPTVVKAIVVVTEHHEAPDTDAKDLAAAVKAAEAAQDAHKAAGGKTTDAEYEAVQEALDAKPQVLATIKTATAALKVETQKLVDASNTGAQKEAVKALEDIDNASDLLKALRSSVLGLSNVKPENAEYYFAAFKALDFTNDIGDNVAKVQSEIVNAGNTAANNEATDLANAIEAIVEAEDEDDLLAALKSAVLALKDVKDANKTFYYELDAHEDVATKANAQKLVNDGNAAAEKAQKETDAVAAVNGAATTAQMAKALKDHAAVIGINASDVTAAVAEAMVDEKPFTSVTEIKDMFETLVELF